MLLLSAIALIICSFISSFVYYNYFSNIIREEVKSVAGIFIDADREDALHILEHGSPTNVRITLIAESGKVLFDNTVDAKAMDNHSERAEVIDALEHGYGESTRLSKTIGEETYYYAVKIKSGDILRVSATRGSIFGMFSKSIPALLLVVATVFLIGSLFARSLTRRIATPLNEIDLSDTEKLSVPYEELEPLVATIQEQRALLSKGDEMRREFSANVSHELKTPLTNISAYAEMLSTNMIEDEFDKSDLYGKIKTEADRMGTLIEDIILLSRLDEGHGELSYENIHIGDLISEVIEALSLKIKRHDITVSSSGSDLYMNANRSLLFEMFFNLIDNAVAYNKPGCNVVVKVLEDESNLIMEVSDTGIGIPEDSLERIFERFYRVDKSRSKKSGGTGLGLAIVKHIALVHGGEVKIVSRENEGTSVTVTFPKVSI